MSYIIRNLIEECNKLGLFINNLYFLSPEIHLYKHSLSMCNTSDQVLGVNEKKSSMHVRIVLQLLCLYRTLLWGRGEIIF